jgi:SMI1 / KNR4 family (SUKH-1)
MLILFLHGWQSVPGGVKPTFLAQHSHEVINPKLPDEDFEEAVKIAQEEFDKHQPQVIVGSSRGSAVAMNVHSSSARLVLLCPAWKKWGTARTVKPDSVILHSWADDVVPFADSEELVRKSGLPSSALIEVGNDHRLADQESLEAMLRACEGHLLMLKELFPHARFSSPATEDAISEADSALGIRLPDQLRVLYLECDGFREDKGNAKYLFSLTHEDFIGSLVSITKFLWTEVKTPGLKSFVFFGSSSGDEFWGINIERPTEIIVHHHNMGDQYEVVGSTICDVWRADYALYDGESRD